MITHYALSTALIKFAKTYGIPLEEVYANPGLTNVDAIQTWLHQRNIILPTTARTLLGYVNGLCALEVGEGYYLYNTTFLKKYLTRKDALKRICVDSKEIPIFPLGEDGAGGMYVCLQATSDTCIYHIPTTASLDNSGTYYPSKKELEVAKDTDLRCVATSPKELLNTILILST